MSADLRKKVVPLILISGLLPLLGTTFFKSFATVFWMTGFTGIIVCLLTLAKAKDDANGTQLAGRLAIGMLAVEVVLVLAFFVFVALVR